MIVRWQETIDQMQRKDLDIEQISLRITEAKDEQRKLKQKLMDKEEFLAIETRNNEETNRQIKNAESSQIKFKEEFDNLMKQKNNFTTELAALKKTVEKTASEVEANRANYKEMKKEFNERAKKLEAIKLVVDNLLQDKDKLNKAVLSSEERNLKMKEFVEQEEKAQKRMLEELRLLKQTHFKKQQVLFEFSEKKKILEVEINSVKVILKNLISKIDNLDQEALKQQKIIYNQDYSLLVANKKLEKAQGDISNEEQSTLESKMKVLTSDLEVKQKIHNSMNKQNKLVQDDIRKVKHELEKMISTKSELSKKTEEMDLYLEVSTKILKNAINEKQDKMVFENLRKLEISRLRNTLFKTADRVLSIEKEKTSLMCMADERLKELNLNRELLLTQLKLSEDEIRKSNAECHVKMDKIEKLKKRHEILIASMISGDDDEEKGMTYYIIKAAQEKEELQREGDELNSQIQLAEQELNALRNTVHVLSQKNEQHRTSINRPNENDQELEEKTSLESQFKECLEDYKYKKDQSKDIQLEIERKKEDFENASKSREYHISTSKKKEIEMLQIQKEFNDQCTKYERVIVMNSKLMKNLKQRVNSQAVELEFKSKEFKELNKFALKELINIINKFPEITATLNMYFEQYNISMPKPNIGRNGKSDISSSKNGTSDISSSNNSTSRSSSLLSLRSSKSSPSSLVISNSRLSLNATSRRQTLFNFHNNNNLVTNNMSKNINTNTDIYNANNNNNKSDRNNNKYTYIEEGKTNNVLKSKTVLLTFEDIEKVKGLKKNSNTTGSSRSNKSLYSSSNSLHSNFLRR